MKKAALLLSLAFILLVATGVLLYLKYSQRDKLSVWRIIPEQAIVVYESGNCKSCLTEFQENPIWASLNDALVNKRAGDFQRMILQDIVSSQNWLASLHLTQKNDFDLVFYISDALDFNGNTERWNKSNNSILATREYSGFTIHELKLKDQVFSWTMIENFWIGGFTTFLIEDVIRTYNSGGDKSFEAKIEAAKKLPFVRNDSGNLYIRYDGLNTLLNSFLLDGSFFELSVGQSALLDIKHGTSFNLSGFSLTGKPADISLLAYFTGQNPVAFSHKRHISNRSLVVTNYGIDKGEILFKNLPIANNSIVKDSLSSLASIHIESLFYVLGKEISVCLFERRKSEMAKIVLFDVADKGMWTRAFDLLSKATERGDSLYTETYGSYELRKVDMNNLPGKLFRPLASGFEQTYYTIVDNTFILSEYATDLKRFLDDIDNEEVWGKSVSANQFLESTLLESNVSIYFNVPLLKNVLTQRMAPTWKTYFMENQSVLNRLGVGAIQFSNLNGMFYTHVILTPAKAESAAKGTKESQHRVQSVMRSSIKSPLFSVRNHTTKRNDIVFQDSLNQFIYLSMDGKIQWSIPLQDKLTDVVKQVDYFNNGKLQLVFSTPGKLHIIDRLGNYVDPFPVSIPVQQTEYINTIDYDNSKRYRFVVSENPGKIWLFDKQGQPLEGWKPKNIEGNLLSAPRHYRIQGKDFIVALRQDGHVYLMNRKGETIKGFPLNLEMRPSGSLYFEPGTSISGSAFTCISNDGIKVRFTAEGKVISREPLVKSSVSDQFSLIEERSSKGYLVARQSPKRLTLFDENNREIIVNDFIGLNRVDIQYYDFGSGKEFVTINDLNQGLCYIYNGEGTLLTNAPIDATEISITWDGNLRLCYAEGKIVTIEPMN